MANSNTNMVQISASQANKEVTLNIIVDALSPAALYGRNAITSAALTWGYYGGTVSISGTPTQIANGAVTLAANATNYVEADPATGSVSVNQTAFTSGRTRLYTVVTGASTVTSWIDWRTGATGATGPAGPGVPVGGTAGQVLTKVSGTDNDTAWTSQPFDLTAFYPGVPPASVKVTRVPFARAVSFPANFAGSVGIASVAATASTVFDVRKNGTSIGSITFAAGATTATFTTSGAVSMAAGDFLSIWSPATPDATLADPGFVLAGSR